MTAEHSSVQDPHADQHLKSITVFKQITRADGTVEEVGVAAYMDRDPQEMARVLKGEKLPDAAQGVVESAAPVEGRITSGQLAVDLLNDVPIGDAKKITELNERRDDE